MRFGCFAGDLLKMYTRYAQLQGWKAELLSLSSPHAAANKLSEFRKLQRADD
jgi:protein subunit release factor A